jgi:glycosyltransferase involved in cell wall biosynthesis
MKIAMIGQKGIPATYGGVERHVEELAASLVERGHEVTAFCRKHYTPATMKEHRGIRLKVLPSIHTKHLDAITGTAAAIGSILGGEYDVVHIHAIGPALLSWLPRLLLRGRSAIVCTIHGLDWRRKKWGALAQWCLQRGESAAVKYPHQTIVVSQTLQEHFARRGHETIHIPNGVEPPAPRPLEQLLRHGVSEGGYVLWLGRFVPEKRVEDLIRAFRKMDANWCLLLGGELDERDPYLRSLRAEADNDVRIIFAGGLYGDAKCEALANAAVFVQPSEIEGFPIALLEAMRYGRPVIASDIPEHLEAVIPDETALTFGMGDTGKLGEKLQWVQDHPDEAAIMGGRSAEAAEAYDWEMVTDRTEAVYREARELI